MNSNVKNDLGKDTKLFLLSELWILILQNGRSVTEYFKKRNVSRILIYGAGRLGKRLLREIELDGTVEVVGVIDQRAIYYFYGVQGFKMTDNMPKADMVVITPVTDIESIKNSLEKKLDVPTVSLWEILKEGQDAVYQEMGLELYTEK